MNRKNSFLRWAGSKKRLITTLSKYWDTKYDRYIEPFAGSASLFFALQPDNAILSDINSDLIGALCGVRDYPQEVYDRLIRFPLGKEAYYKIRQESWGAQPYLDQAARFIYLNRFCFNGLYRTNLKGQFNVPYASLKTGRLPTLDELKGAAKVLSNATIMVRDYGEAIKSVKSGDFIYLDPPYAVRNRRIFHQYGPDSFGTEDLMDLAMSLTGIHEKGATFLVSYALCDEALEAFKGWKINTVKTQRSIAGFSQHRQIAEELLVTNK